MALMVTRDVDEALFERNGLKPAIKRQSRADLSAILPIAVLLCFVPISALAEAQDGENESESTFEKQGWAGLKLKAGRQRIKLDDDRWVGNVGWRQNEQTYDAARLQTNLGFLYQFAYLDGGKARSPKKTTRSSCR
jgi:hypothetical protein